MKWPSEPHLGLQRCVPSSQAALPMSYSLWAGSAAAAAAAGLWRLQPCWQCPQGWFREVTCHLCKGHPRSVLWTVPTFPGCHIIILFYIAWALPGEGRRRRDETARSAASLWMAEWMWGERDRCFCLPNKPLFSAWTEAMRSCSANLY